MRICLLECGDRGTGTLGRQAQTRPDRASCRVLECSAIRSVRPSAWLRRQERLRRVKPSTNALLAFGGMTSTGGDGAEECFFERAPDRAVAGMIDNAELPPCSPTTARSSVRVLWAAWNRPRQSAWPPSRRQKSEQRQASRAACGSTRPRSLLPPVACAPDKPWMGWFPELR